MAHAKNHDYHILPPSVFPFYGAVSAFLMLFGAVAWISGGFTTFFGSVDLPGGPWLFLIGFVGEFKGHQRTADFFPRIDVVEVTDIGLARYRL